mmetsp:Transcript_35179/g.105060  ORF Transcript_35179/g.105060 Transcript_35179/m.105060 type:complete len:116 (+) Transcript_35179:547-894(+)
MKGVISVSRVEANAAAMDKQLQKLPMSVLQIKRKELDMIESEAALRDDPDLWRETFPQENLAPLTGTRRLSSSRLPSGNDFSNVKNSNPLMIKYKGLSPLLSPSRLEKFYGHFRT